jgi:hypothetical protein
MVQVFGLWSSRCVGGLWLFVVGFFFASSLELGSGLI